MYWTQQSSYEISLNISLSILFCLLAGSRFWQGGTFEVTKKEDDPSDLTDSPTPGQPKSALKVTVPSELEGVAYIQVIIKRQSGAYLDFIFHPLTWNLLLKFRETVLCFCLCIC